MFKKYWNNQVKLGGYEVMKVSVTCVLTFYKICRCFPQVSETKFNILNSSRIWISLIQAYFVYFTGPNV
jgi:uncharacterized membrane protein